ncbi:hypothetical protein EXU57_19845 [Segetibacter sp. 3557_3]|uniref:hypothetical protein n=1 Tax=Segetibacter sp. 3557_3 TaxID=2547429 RepID=UPI001058702F|nr:hypothetical protein [Segetibacter sp. 3557_3]TDH21450.1 hypothetical protein EXU57_19845 [Segetibacter sp. 3557_3]
MRKHILSAIAFILVFSPGFAQSSISPKDAGKYVGDKVTVCGKTSGFKKDGTRPTLIYIGSGTASSQMNIVINSGDLKNFPYKPEEYLTNKNVCVSGKVSEQNGKPEIVVRSPENIRVEEETGDVEIRPLSLEGLNRYFEEK